MKLAQRVLLWSLFLSTFSVYAQNSVGIGTANPNKNAVLELISPGNNQGILIPKLTTGQRTATSFTSGLATKESGLMVFDSDENKFYYWNSTGWKEFGTGSDLAGGTGISIVNNTISTIPQDLVLTGSSLAITNNPDATPIDLSPFSGTNTDDQTLTYDAATGALSISKLTGGSQGVSLTTSGTAGGDLIGSYPNPTVANDVITSAKIVDGTIASADILDGTIAAADIADNAITSVKILDGVVTSADILDATVASIDITDGTIATADIADNAITSVKILDGTIASVDILDGTVSSTDILNATVVSADIANNTITGTNILDLTIATIDIADNAITSVKVLDGTIATNDILDATILGADISTGAVATGNILDGTVATIDLGADAVTTGKILDGTILGADISASAVTTGNILDGTITNGDISATAGIAASKMSIGTPGQVLTTSGTTAAWADPSGSVLINNAGTHNLFAGASVGSPAAAGTSSDNTYYGYSAGTVNTLNGNYNVAVGSQVGYQNVNGDLNVLVGWHTAAAVTGTGFNGNVMVGAQAGESTTDGPNVFIGEKSGQFNTTGTLNVYVGNGTGSKNTTGFGNTLIGYQADMNLTGGYNNATAIGYQAVVDATNKIRLGNNAVSVIEGQVAFTNASDRRLKSNIQPLATGLDFITRLKPVSYVMKDVDDKRTNWGFIAQDIEELVGTNNAVLTIRNDKDRTLGLRYTDFVAPLVKAVQEQQQEIVALNDKLSESEKKVEALATEIEQIKKAIGLKAGK